MKTYDIDFISDLHLDYWIKMIPHSPKLVKTISLFIRDVLKPKGGDVLVLAGDTGHYFVQDAELIKQLKTIYKEVVIVTGNHDMYLVSHNQQKKYHQHSYERIDEMRDFCDLIGVHYLEGTTVDIDGLIIGGTGMWYNLESDDRLARWNIEMNDANLIMDGQEPIKYDYGYGSYKKVSRWDSQEHYLKEVERLKQLEYQGVDVLVTHVLPVILPEYKMVEKYRGDKNNIFYMSNNIDIVKAIDPQVTIFGHTHENYDLNIDDYWFVCNPLGYKSEQTNNEIRQLTITK